MEYTSHFCCEVTYKVHENLHDLWKIETFIKTQSLDTPTFYQKHMLNVTDTPLISQKNITTLTSVKPQNSPQPQKVPLTDIEDATTRKKQTTRMRKKKEYRPG